MTRTKNKKQRFIAILIISLAVLVFLIFFAIRKFRGGGFGFGQKERFFLNGTINKTEEELISALGQPDRITEYAGNYVYSDFELAGMKGPLIFDIRNGVIFSAHWTLEDVDVDDYWPQINKIAGYFNKHYNQTDTWDWRKGENRAYIVGIDTGYYIRVLFQ